MPETESSQCGSTLIYRKVANDDPELEEVASIFVTPIATLDDIATVADFHIVTESQKVTLLASPYGGVTTQRPRR